MCQGAYLMYLQYTFWMVEDSYVKLNGSQTLPFIMLFFNIDYAVLYLMDMIRSQVSKTMNIRDVQGVHPPI